MKRCPHDDVQYCPLYVAMHSPGAPSCHDGHLDDGRCAVARGRRQYRAIVEVLRVKVAGLVEDCEWRKHAASVKAQRVRNLRLNGIHCGGRYGRIQRLRETEHDPLYHLVETAVAGDL